MERSTFAGEVTRLIALLGTPRIGRGAGCGVGETPEVDDARDRASAPEEEGIVTLQKDGCSNSILIRAIEPELRVEVQTVPQTEQIFLQAREGEGGAVEWVTGGGALGTDELARDLERLWTAES